MPKKEKVEVKTVKEYLPPKRGPQPKWPIVEWLESLIKETSAWDGKGTQPALEFPPGSFEGPVKQFSHAWWRYAKRRGLKVQVWRNEGNFYVRINTNGEVRESVARTRTRKSPRA